ncbi:unnamed protein product [Rotaria sordida]|uniref:MAM domain-containing protein n=1 Tax=Rotaria sordida TaxID=392033 RepID=A0A819QHT1_9BILA|nr:unnamed protein product [Rotaria sordida]
MLFLFFIFFEYILCSQTAISLCDFETFCNDFIIDNNWGLTDGLHPQSIDHDHTLNTSSGHYLSYTPQKLPPFFDIKAGIKTNDWLQPSTDRAVCFRIWYYTPQFTLPFTIQLVQGDDVQLSRIIASIPASEKIKIAIRLNDSTIPLTFDDLSVDYCDGPRPSPPTNLYACDFESSCIEDFSSLPNYPYQWLMMKASDAIKIESQAPSVDFTSGNQSGHYVFVPNSNTTKAGNVGYLALQTSFNITMNESFCLNFQYYNYGQTVAGNLNVYAQLSESSETVQKLWPPIDRQHIYTRNKWIWGIVNLPVGYYSLLFRVDTTGTNPYSFALDNISITSCDYPSSTFTDDNVGLLSFSCNFDNLTMCEMENGDRSIRPTHNFTIVTGDTVPNRKLGPTRDHTSNSSTGGFIYWDRQLPFAPTDLGYIHPPKPMVVDLSMCIRFAYYIKSSIDNKNGTTLGLTDGGCFGSTLWYIYTDDSQGWQVIILPVPNVVCMESFYFTVYQQPPVVVAVALDDIAIEHCSTLSPTTTSISTTTTVTTTVSTTITTTTQIITTTSTSTLQTITSSTTTVILTTSTMSTSTSTQNNARRSLSLNGFNVIVICFLLKIFRKLL